MAVDTIFRRLRGAFGNALAWGVGWFTAGLALFSTLHVTGIALVDWSDVLFATVAAGILGGVAGGAFSIVIGPLYRGRRLSQISWVRFGIGGGVVTGLFVPVFLQAMNLLSGDGMVPWALVLDDIPLVAVLGAAAAGGSLKLAQLGENLLPGGSPCQSGRLGAGDTRESAGGQPVDAPLVQSTEGRPL